MPSFNAEIDTPEWTQQEVLDLLDHCWDNHKKVTLDWINDIMDDYICPDCPGKDRR